MVGSTWNILSRTCVRTFTMVDISPFRVASTARSHFHMYRGHAISDTRWETNLILNKSCPIVFLPVCVNARPKSDTGKATGGQGIHEQISALQTKKRSQRKRRVLGEEEDNCMPGFFSVIAYATAEEYNLEKLHSALIKQNLYHPSPMYECMKSSSQAVAQDFLHVCAKYPVGPEPREIYFFREGSVVFWNVNELESINVINFIKPFEDNSYYERLLMDESEKMFYTYSETNGKTRLIDGNVVLSTDGPTDFEKYTVSNSMSLSVKLGIWEASLDRYVDSIEYVTEDLKRGEKIKMTREEVLRKTGELFALRHLINLSSDLLDTPDFYWEREELEDLYHKTCSHFNITKRTKVMNEKLNHCFELVELLSSHLNDKHHVRLEWMIIILIMVEVGFEVLHYADRFFN